MRKYSDGQELNPACEACPVKDYCGYWPYELPCGHAKYRGEWRKHNEKQENKNDERRGGLRDGDSERAT